MYPQVFLILFVLIKCYGYQNSWNSDFRQNQIPQEIMVDVINNLALQMLAIHNEGNDNNIAISPYGAASVLAALIEGTRGSASEEIRRAARIPLDRQLLRIGLRDIHRHLKSYFIPEEGFLSGLTLSSDNIHLNPEYENILRFYGFDINSFSNALFSGSTTTEVISTSTPVMETTSEAITTNKATVVAEAATTSEAATITTALATTTEAPTTIKTSTTTEAPTTTEASTTTEAPTTTVREALTTTTEVPVTTSEVSTTTTESTTKPMESTTIVQSTTEEINTEVEIVTVEATSVSTSVNNEVESTTQIPESTTLEATTNTETTEATTVINDDDRLRRDSRSVVDYIVARYYDEHVITQRPPYNSADDFYFYINGKHKESNIHFMTYDTVLPFHYVPHLRASALRFPLDSSRYYLLLLLPDSPSQINRLVCDLRLHGNLKYIVNNLRYTHVKAVIPSFFLKGNVGLTATLQKMGVYRVLEPRQADFSPMTSDPDIYVTNIEQAITVNIKNYVDPASMNNEFMQQTSPVPFKVEHPFLYFVIDSEIDVTLMMGKVVNPINSRIR